MARGNMVDARKALLSAINQNPNEYGAYYNKASFQTKEEAYKLLGSINDIKGSEVTIQDKFLVEFALSNCLHKARDYNQSAKHTQIANEYKLILMPSNIKAIQQSIAESLSDCKDLGNTGMNANTGEERIFIVGMPRSGSSLLETILSMNQQIKDLGETNP